MLSLFSAPEKKMKKQSEELKRGKRYQYAKEMFFSGRFPVVTTPMLQGRRVKKVLGLVSGRGFDADCAFMGLAAQALDIGADGIVGYMENVAFHPDGSRYFSCYGTAVIFDKTSVHKSLQ